MDATDIANIGPQADNEDGSENICNPNATVYKEVSFK